MSDDQASLESQRDFLLRSIEDLDREHAAGDLDDADHAALRADYTARAAEVLRRMEHGGEVLVAPAAAAEPERAAPRAARNARTTRIVTIAALAVAAVGAGLAVARSAGERTAGELLTGGDRVAASMTPEQDAARRLLEAARQNLTTDRLAAIQDFDSAWKLDRTLVEAPTYAAWLLRLIAQGVEDPEQRRVFIDGARRRLDEAIATDPNYPDARAFRGIIRLRDLGDPVGAAADFDVLESLDPPDEIRDLVGGAAEEAAAAVAGGATPSTAPVDAPTSDAPTDAPTAAPTTASP